MRRGYTLIEVLLVLAVIVLIAAIASPALQKPLARRHVEEAADTVRTKMFHARLDAMRSSHVYSFQFMPGSGSYRLGPQGVSGEVSAANEGDCLRPEDGLLLDDIRFLTDKTPDTSAPDDAAANAPPGEDAGDGWSDPIYFYPDGTASDARFIIANTRGCALRVKLRGVTGAVSVDDAGPLVE